MAHIHIVVNSFLVWCLNSLHNHPFQMPDVLINCTMHQSVSLASQNQSCIVHTVEILSTVHILPQPLRMTII